ncbi:MAG: urease accessory protein UreD [Hyphomicrobiales bacterium]
MLALNGQLSEESPAPEAAPLRAAGPAVRLQRALGEARVAFKRRAGATVLDDLHQSGCCKLRIPRPLPGAGPEAVFINTAGGLTDGDAVSLSAGWGEGTWATISTQAAERIYRSRGLPARALNRLDVAAEATALWLPQETILFDGGRLKRRFDARIDEGGRLLACESTVFGRTAMGETVRDGALHDSWRIRIGGRLVFADGLNLDGRIDDVLDRPAIGAGARAIASVVYAGPGVAGLVEPLRAAMAGLAATCGCSVNGPVLIARILARESKLMRDALRTVLEAALTWLRGKREDLAAAAVLPRVWTC